MVVNLTVSHGVARCRTFLICYTVTVSHSRCSTVSHSMRCYTFKSSHTKNFDGVANKVLHRGFCSFCKPHNVKGLRESDGVAFYPISYGDIYAALVRAANIPLHGRYARTIAHPGCGL